MEQANPAHFFNPWEPPPSFVPPPQDAGLIQRVAKLTEFAKRNGPNFVELIKKKQQDNAEYTFLFGGEGSDYYRWVLYCSLYNLPPDQPPPVNYPYPDHPQMFGHQHSVPDHQDMHVTNQQDFGQNYSQNVHGRPGSFGGGSGSIAEGLNLPMDVGTGFAQVLEALNGSKDSIKASQNWFMACVQFADGLAAMMARQVLRLQDHSKQLHIIYLANDILFKSLSQRRHDQLDIVARAFQPVMGAMLGATYLQGGQSSEAKQRLSKILSFWGERGVYDPATIAMLEQAMLSGNTTMGNQFSGRQPSMPQAHNAQVDQGNQMPVHRFDHPAQDQQNRAGHMEIDGHRGDSAMPPWQPQGPPVQHPPQHPHSSAVPWQGGSMMRGGQFGYSHPEHPPAHSNWQQNQAPPAGPPAAWPGNQRGTMFSNAPTQAGSTASAPPVRAAFDPPPSQEPPSGLSVNPMAFPPGLIPKLVRDKGRHTLPYSPLSPLEIDRAGLPPPPDSKDPYLRSRLEKFYADLEDYRPGIVRTGVDDRKDRRSARESEDEGRRGSRKKRSGFDHADPSTGMLADGSYAGPPGASSSMYAGLGANTRHRDPDEEDVYQSYRRMRSDVYHQSVTRGVSNVARGGS